MRGWGAGVVAALALATATPALAHDPALAAKPLPASSPYTEGEAQSGALRFIQLWTGDPAAFQREWAGTTPPHLGTSRKAARGEVLQMFIVIANCTRDRSGACQLEATFQLSRPDGSPDGDAITFTAWQADAPTANRLVLSPASIGAFIEEGDPAGNYTARLTITDAVSREAASSTVVLTFTE